MARPTISTSNSSPALTPRASTASRGSKTEAASSIVMVVLDMVFSPRRFYRYRKGSESSRVFRIRNSSLRDCSLKFGFVPRRQPNPLLISVARNLHILYEVRQFFEPKRLRAVDQRAVGRGMEADKNHVGAG